MAVYAGAKSSELRRKMEYVINSSRFHSCRGMCTLWQKAYQYFPVLRWYQDVEILSITKAWFLSLSAPVSAMVRRELQNLFRNELMFLQALGKAHALIPYNTILGARGRRSYLKESCLSPRFSRLVRWFMYVSMEYNAAPLQEKAFNASIFDNPPDAGRRGFSLIPVDIRIWTISCA
jgi:hypothetical protein